MKYTEELKYIQEKISELRLNTELSRNIPLMKLLINYEEFEKPALTNNLKINKR